MSSFESVKVEDHSTVSIKVPSGEVLQIETSSNTIVRDLKLRIMKMLQLPVPTQIIHLGKQRLCNKVQLSAYNLSKESVLVLKVMPINPEEIIRQLGVGVFKLTVTNLPSSSGYPKEIFTSLLDIDKLSAFCVVCQKIPRNVMELDCDECMGKICETCLNTAMKSAITVGNEGKIICLSEGCEKLIDLKETVKSRSIRKLIKQQKVKCTSKIKFDNRTCSWTGTIAELDEHIKICNFQEVYCPFKCGITISKGFANLEGHFAECPLFFLKCHHCAEFYVRREIDDHEGKCPEELFLCDFNCGKKLVRRDIETHNRENVLIHFHCLKKELDFERKERKKLEAVSKKLEIKLSLERKKNQSELDGLKKMLGGKEVIQFLVGFSRINIWQNSAGVFDASNSSDSVYITAGGKRVSTKEGSGTAGCNLVLKQGTYVFKVWIYDLHSRYSVGFFPKLEDKPSNNCVMWDNGRPGSYSFDGSNLYGCDKNNEFPTGIFKGSKGDFIVAMLDLDQGTISYQHNGNYLGVAFTNVKGMYYAGVSLDGGTRPDSYTRTYMTSSSYASIL